MVGHRVEITWPINPLPPSKRKKHGKNISQIDIYGVSRCKPIPPHTKKETCLINIKQAQTKQLYDYMIEKKISPNPPASENASLLRQTHDLLLTESGGWTDSAQLCITSFKFRAVLVSFFFGFHMVSPCISYFGMGSPTKKTWRQEKYQQQKHQFNSSCNSLYIVYDSIVYTCTVHIT